MHRRPRSASTVTYPATPHPHGAWPVKHHIYSNVVFDPLDRNLAGWIGTRKILPSYIVEAASKAGMVVAV